MTPFYLKFVDESEMQSVLYTEGVPNYQNICNIGIIMNNNVSPPIAYSGYYSNVLAIDGEDMNTLNLYAINPPAPQVTWAI
jgi:hypothetical protein